jgi:hypothetical protein
LKSHGLDAPLSLHRNLGPTLRRRPIWGSGALLSRFFFEL